MSNRVKLATRGGLHFPDHDVMRAELEQALDWAGIGQERELRQRYGWAGQVPPLPKELLDTALLREIRSLRPDEEYFDPAHYLDRLDPAEMRQLYGHMRWLTAPEDEAAEFDQAFGYSHRYPGLRDQYHRALAERPRHQREIDFFVHAAEAYHREGRKPCWPLVSQLPRPDVALWHEIATDMYKMRGNRLDAVLWILSQRLCDRATIYRFLQGAFAFGSMAEWVERRQAESPEAAAAMIATLERVIDGWNSGFYHQSNLAPTLHGELAPMEGTPDLPQHAAACYDAYPELARLLPHRPMPRSIPLAQPDDRKLRLYSRPSGYCYDPEHGELQWMAGEPQLADFLSWRPTLPA